MTTSTFQHFLKPFQKFNKCQLLKTQQVLCFQKKTKCFKNKQKTHFKKKIKSIVAHPFVPTSSQRPGTPPSFPPPRRWSRGRPWEAVVACGELLAFGEKNQKKLQRHQVSINIMLIFLQHMINCLIRMQPSIWQPTIMKRLRISGSLNRETKQQKIKPK